MITIITISQCFIYEVRGLEGERETKGGRKRDEGRERMRVGEGESTWKERNK